MILPPEDGCRNKLSRKSRAKAMARGQGKKKQKPRKQKPQPASNNSQRPEEAAKMAPRGGLPIVAAAGLDQLEQVNRNAAGIDLGADVHFVAVPPGRDPETHVRCFGTFTADLQALADWLEQCGITTVAMESTGIYWIPLYDLLEQRGFEVLLFDNIIVYSKSLKRRSQSNIILGGFSGGAPALIGYLAVTTNNREIGLVMAGLVFLWIPTHIWSLALHVKKDYEKAKVPMLPVVSDEKKSVRIIAATTLMMVVFSILPFTFNQFGQIYLITASVFVAIMLTLSIWLLIKPSEKASWTVFKFSSPYLTAIFIAFMIDAFFR